MGRIGRYFDRRGRKQRLDYARLSIVTSVLFCGMGGLELSRSHKTGEQFGFYWGVFFVAFGLFGIWYKSMELRAVVRRERAESQD